MLRRVFYTVVLLSGLAWTSANAETIRVVTSIGILADVAKQLGGDHVEVSSIIGINDDPHMYRLRPKDIQTIQNADIVFLNGLGLVPNIEKAVDANAKGIIIRVAESIENKLEMDHAHHHDHGDHEEHDDHKGHKHGKHHDDHDDHKGHKHGNHHDDHDDHKGHKHGKHHDDDHDHHKGHKHGKHHDDHDDHKGHKHGKHHDDHDDHKGHKHGKHHDDHDDHKGHKHGKHHDDHDDHKGHKHGKHHDDHDIITKVISMASIMMTMTITKVISMASTMMIMTITKVISMASTMMIMTIIKVISMASIMMIMMTMTITKKIPFMIHTVFKTPCRWQITQKPSHQPMLHFIQSMQSILKRNYQLLCKRRTNLMLHSKQCLPNIRINLQKVGF